MNLDSDGVREPRLRSFSKPKLPSNKKNASYPRDQATLQYLEGNTGSFPVGQAKSKQKANKYEKSDQIRESEENSLSESQSRESYSSDRP